MHSRDQNKIGLIQGFENELNSLQYYPPNEVETSSTEKEHWNGLDLKDRVSTYCSLQKQPNPQ